MSENAPQNDIYSDIDIHSDVALADIRAERKRQTTEEGYAPKHDDEHVSDELAFAAACYAIPPMERFDFPVALQKQEHYVPRYWFFQISKWKPTPTDRRRELVKAGALIVAEIARLDRAVEKK